MLAVFHNTWDWTAIGTLALAAITLAAVIVATVSLRQTRQAIVVSRKEVEEAHRPVVVPVVLVDETPAAKTASVSRSRGRYTMPLRPSIVDSGVLALPLRNIGSGPALNIKASITRIEEDGSLFPGPREPHTPGTVTGIGKNETAPIEIFSHGWEATWNFELAVTYTDVAGESWTTKARYLSDRERYEDVAINRLAKD